MKDMEAKTTKMIAAVAVIVMCAAGLVGAGYAYTASTVNNSNTATSEYVVLTQSGTGAYTFSESTKVYYDTYNSDSVSGTTYLLNSPITISDNTNSYKVVKIGKTFTINAAHTPANVTDLTSMECAITFNDGLTLTNNYLLIFKVTNNTTTSYLVYNGTSWTGGDNTFTIGVKDGSPDTYYSSTVDVYYGYLTTATPTASTAPSATPIDHVTFYFTAEKPELHNNLLVILGDAIDNDSNKLADVSVTVKSGNTTLTVETHYTVAWQKNGTPVADASTEEIAAGAVYTAIITGVGTYLGQFGEASVTATAAS